MPVRILIVCGGSGIKLLGQRSVLGVDAEIQIDVGEEIRRQHPRATDPSSYSIALDKNIGTTGFLFRDIQTFYDIRTETKDVGPDPSRVHGMSIYLNPFSSPQAREHFKVLKESIVAHNELRWGLAQSPPIGGLTIRHPQNRMALQNVLTQILAQRGLGPDNPVEAWIVSSTAGGTGEGIHRFIGAFLAQFVANRAANTHVALNYIRVGQLTYRSVNETQTALNTLFGVAADAAFFMLSRTAQNLVTNWFYVDLPDVGKGPGSIPLRAQLVELAAKAIMLPELQQSLQGLLVNNNGIRMVVTRTGYWGRDFEAQRKYYETLRQLRDKLEDLLDPNYEANYISKAKSPPNFHPGNLRDVADHAGNARWVQRRMEEGWRFPQDQMRRYPQNLNEVREWVESWKQAMERLLGERWENVVRGAKWEVERVREEAEGEQREMVPLQVAQKVEVPFGTPEWFERIKEAHEALAWARHLLGCDLRSGQPQQGGRVEQLLHQARSISTVLYGFNPFRGTEARAREAADRLREFVKLLAQVDQLLTVEDAAWKRLQSQLSQAREVQAMADAEFQRLRQRVGGGGAAEVVRAAKLEARLDQATGATWLQLLWDAVRRGDPDAFCEAVLRGAVGLTEAGLWEVLGLPPRATVADAHNEMAERMGRMYTPDGKFYEAPWWARTTPEPNQEYNYRILPLLDKDLQKDFQNYKRNQPASFEYVFAEMGMIGLYVLAFQGVSLTAQAGDTLSAPVYLLRPFVPQLLKTLGEPAGNMQLVLSGVIGEPLYLPALRKALREAGLADNEAQEAIKRIGKFYSFINDDGTFYSFTNEG
jgi:hypothetical protein